MEIIPCRQATLLVSKREERALTIRERFQLYVHLAICVFCRRFIKQTKSISRAAKEILPEEKLTPDEKRKMAETLGL